MRPRDIGTLAESAVCTYFRDNGFPGAERRALRGNLDAGDLTGLGPLVVEVKGGKAAERASDGQVELWLAETEVERRNAKADIGVLVMKRAGIGSTRAGSWWAVLTVADLGDLLGAPWAGAKHPAADTPVRLHLSTAVALLRAAGYGTPDLEESA